MPEVPRPSSRPWEVIGCFATDEQLRAVLADPAVAQLPDGPARELLTRLAVVAGPYTLEVEVDVKRRPRDA